jgi:all-trans-retinol 13,14-reductase
MTADAQGAFSGVRLASGESVEGKGCIATVHPRLLQDLAPERAFRPTYRKRLDALEETVSAFLAFAVCEKPLALLAGVNRFQLPDAESIHEIGNRAVGSTPVYLTGAYHNGESVPSGFVAVFPANFTETALWENSKLGNRPAAYLQFKQQALELMRNRIERLNPDLDGNIKSFEISTPLTVRDYAGAPLGGLYGVKHMVGQFNPQPATRMKGLYLAGQALVSPGIMGAVLSGLLACGAIIGHEQMKKELKSCC